MTSNTKMKLASYDIVILKTYFSHVEVFPYYLEYKVKDTHINNVNKTPLIRAV